MHLVMHKAQSQQPRWLVFPEGEDETIIRAARAIADERIARPILLGRREVIEERTSELGFGLHDYDIVYIERSEERTRYADLLYKIRARKGMTPRRALTRVLDPTIFALMMVRMGEADGFVGGMTRPYPETIRPAIRLVGLRPECRASPRCTSSF